MSTPVIPHHSTIGCGNSTNPSVFTQRMLNLARRPGRVQTLENVGVRSIFRDSSGATENRWVAGSIPALPTGNKPLEIQGVSSFPNPNPPPRTFANPRVETTIQTGDFDHFGHSRLRGGFRSGVENHKSYLFQPNRPEFLPQPKVALLEFWDKFDQLAPTRRPG